MQPAGNFLMKWKLVASSSWAARYISYLMVIWYHKITRMLSTGFSLSWNLLTNISLSKHYHPILRSTKKILNTVDVSSLGHIQNKNTFSNCTNSGVTFIPCHIYKKIHAWMSKVPYWNFTFCFSSLKLNIVPIARVISM